MTENTKDLRFETAHLHSDLKGHSLRGGSAVMLSQGAIFMLRLVSTAILARLLSPTDFGLIAMVVTVAAFADIFKDIGLSLATVQWEKLTHHQASNLFWINTATGAATMVALMAFSPVMVWFYDEPRLMSIGLWLSLMFLFGGLSAQHSALLKRQMRFGLLSLGEVLAMLLSVLVAVLLAWRWRGEADAYMALVWMMISRPFFVMMAVWMTFRWVPGWVRRRVGTGDLVKFGAGVTGFNIVNYVTRSADNILIGRFFGSLPLGLYAKAYQFLLLPIQQLRTPLVSVALPALSALQHDPVGYRRYMQKLLAILAFMTMPMMIYAAVFADMLVLVFFGPQWVAAIPFFTVFALLGFLQPVAGMCGLVLTTTGRARRFFLYGLLNGVIALVSFLMGLRWGAIGVAVAYTLANYLTLLPVWAFCFRGSPVSVDSFTVPLLRPALNSVAMGCFMWYGRALLPLPESVLLALFLSVLLSVLVYLLLFLASAGGRAFLSECLAYGRLVAVRAAGKSWSWTNGEIGRGRAS